MPIRAASGLFYAGSRGALRSRRAGTGPKAQQCRTGPGEFHSVTVAREQAPPRAVCGGALKRCRMLGNSRLAANTVAQPELLKPTPQAHPYPRVPISCSPLDG